jgi:translation elongation factor EF-G
LITKSKVYNPAKQVNEKIDKIYVPFSNQLKQVNKITNGNIAIVSGLLKVNGNKIANK